MRRVKEEELPKLAGFMLEQFFEKEEMQIMFRGIEQEKAKQLATEIVYYELLYMFKKGDIVIYDDAITAAIVGIEAKKLLTLSRLLISLKASKVLKKMTEKELEYLKENTKIIKEVHSIAWYKTYCKNPYYFAQFGIAKEKRGQGIAREMLEYLFTYVAKKKDAIVLETLTETNVPIYEHFGFHLKETKVSTNKELTEYRLIKQLTNDNKKTYKDTSN